MAGALLLQWVLSTAAPESYLIPARLGVVRVDFDALDQLVTLHTRKPVPLARWLAQKIDSGAVCPVIQTVPGAVVLGCVTRSVEARLQGRTLRILQTEGIPTVVGVLALPEHAPCEDCTGAPSETLRTAMELRHVRALAFSGQSVEAARVLGERLAQSGREPACAGLLGFCQRIILQALRDADTDQLDVVLASWSRLPLLERGPLWMPLSQAAAARLRDAGEPDQAAQVLSRLTPEVEAGALEEHLQLTAECFLESDDDVSAAAVVAYARTRLPGQRFGSPRWRDLVAALEPADEEPEGPVVGLWP